MEKRYQSVKISTHAKERFVKRVQNLINNGFSKNSEHIIELINNNKIEEAILLLMKKGSKLRKKDYSRIERQRIKEHGVETIRIRYYPFDFILIPSNEKEYKYQMITVELIGQCRGLNNVT